MIKDFGVASEKVLDVTGAYLLNGNVLAVVRVYGLDVAYELSKGMAKFRGYVGSNGSSIRLLEGAKKFPTEKLLTKIKNTTFTIVR